MAISQMEKISVILPKEAIDTALVTLQQLEHIQVRELRQMEAWQAAFANEQVVPLEMTYFDIASNQTLTGEAATQALFKRQQMLEATIAQLETYVPQPGMIASLRQKQPTLQFEELEDLAQSDQDAALLEVQQHIKWVGEIDDAIAEHEREFERLHKWAKLTVTPQDLSHYQFIKGLIGTIPNSLDNQFMRALRKDPFLAYEEVYADETEYGLIIFYDGNLADQADVHLEAISFKAFDYNLPILPKRRMAELDRELAQMNKNRQDIITSLEMSQARLEQLRLKLDANLNLQARQAAKANLATSQHLVAIEGWVEVDNADRLKAKLHKVFGDGIHIIESPVTEADWDEVPIRLKNNAFVEPFETVTEMYALPKYYEKDPTPILAPLYFVFFGMMVADIGYGLIVYIATFLALKSFKLEKGMLRFMRFFNLLGIATTLWGLIYGSFFGYELPFKLISTTTDVMTILVLSVAFGFITMLIGLFLGGQQKYRMKDYAGAYNDGFAWCMILLGVLMLVVDMFIPTLAWLGTIGKWLAIVNAAGIVIVSIISSKSFAGLGSGLYNLYNASSYVGDLVSFTRLMALGLSGASIGSAFNLIVNLMPPASRLTIGILLFIILHLVNLFLSLLSAYVHGARLIFVELFGKFYEGGGKAFQPLQASEKYIKIKKETQMEEK